MQASIQTYFPDAMSGRNKKKQTGGQGTSSQIDDPIPLLSQTTQTNMETPEATGDSASGIQQVLSELKAMREDATLARQEVKEGFTKLENTISEIATKSAEHEARLDTVEQRVSDLDDSNCLRDKALIYLLKQNETLLERQEDTENRLRRSNIRISNLPEKAEMGQSMERFVEDLIHSSLKLSEENHVHVVRAHRALTRRPIKPGAPPRQILACFLDFEEKQQVLSQLWKLGKNFTFEGTRLYADNDFSAKVQRMRSHFRLIRSQLAAKHVNYSTPYPARLILTINSERKSFENILQALPTLESLGIVIPPEKVKEIRRDLEEKNWIRDLLDRPDRRMSSRMDELNSFRNLCQPT